jgi:hypothetical protein
MHPKPKPTPDEEKFLAKVAELVLALSKAIQAIPGINRNDMWPLHPDREATAEYSPARHLVDQLISRVRSRNRLMVSDRLVLEKLLYGVAALPLGLRVSDEELLDEAKSKTYDLIRFQAHRQIDVPVVSLDVEGKPFTIGPVLFSPYSDADKSSDWWLQTAGYVGDMANEMLLSFASVRAPGDLFNSVRYAAAAVSDALLLLRAIGFPIWTTEIHQIGIINDYPLWQSTPYRLAPPTENVRLEFPSPLVTTIGPFRFPHYLHRDILSSISPRTLKSLTDLLARTGFSPSGQIERKLIGGLRWLGEATRPDTASARFAKLAFALEALVGGEPSGDLSATSMGITATLAERSAFLVGTSAAERLSLDEEVRDLYTKRSAIVHGESADADPNDIPRFGRLVRRVAWGLLDHIDAFGTVNDMQKWVLARRYEAS